MKFSEMKPLSEFSKQLWFPVLSPDSDGDGIDENTRISSDIIMTFINDVVAKNKPNFLSFNANPKPETKPNYNADSAVGIGTMVLGPNDPVKGTNLLIIGTNNKPSDTSTNHVFIGKGITQLTSVLNSTDNIALGNKIQLSDSSQIAIGEGLAVTGTGGIAIGKNSTSGLGSLVIGNNSKDTKYNSILIGGGTTAYGYQGVAIGINSNVSDNGGMAIGMNSVSGRSSISIGINAKTPTGYQAVNIGNNTTSDNANTITLGSNSNGGGASITIGVQSKNNTQTDANNQTNSPAIVIGHKTVNDKPSNISIGHFHAMTADSNVAIGNNITSTTAKNTIIGHDNQGGNRSRILGDTNSDTGGQDNTVVGHNVKVNNSSYNIVMGNNSTIAKSDNNVILTSGANATVSDEPMLKNTVRIGNTNTATVGRKQDYLTEKQICIGTENKTDGSNNITLGNKNTNTYLGAGATDGRYNVTIGNDNNQFGTTSLVVGNLNNTIEIANIINVRNSNIGCGNTVGGNQSIAVGVFNTLTKSGRYQQVSMIGQNNDVSGDLSNVAVFGYANALTNTIKDNVVSNVSIFGHNNKIQPMDRQVIIGHGITNVGYSTPSVEAIGSDIRVTYGNVTYLGNGATVDFVGTNTDASFAEDMKNQGFSYLTRSTGYKLNTDPTKDTFYIDKRVLALAKHTIIRNVGDGVLDDDAVTIAQLKKLTKTAFNDFELYSKANEFAAINLGYIDLSPIFNIVWSVTSKVPAGILATTVLSTFTEKRTWLKDNFDIVQEYGNYQFLRYKGSVELQITYKVTRGDGSKIETLPAGYVLNGGYDALTNTPVKNGLSPLQLPSGWKFNHSLRPISSDIFFIKPARSAIDWNTISGKPTSSAADIDDAVTERHSHSNYANLDLIGSDQQGNLTYESDYPKTPLMKEDW